MAENLSAQPLLDVAAVAAANGDARTAVRALCRALTLQEATLGPAHPEVATTLNNLAVAYEWLGQEADAEQCYRRSHDVACEAFPAGHPQLLTTRRNLDEFCRARGLAVDAPHSSKVAGQDALQKVPRSVPQDVRAAVHQAEARQPGRLRATAIPRVLPHEPPSDHVAPAQFAATGSQPLSQTVYPGRSARSWTPLRAGLAAAAVTLVAVSGAMMLRGSSLRVSSAPDVSPPASTVEVTASAPEVTPGEAFLDVSKKAETIREPGERVGTSAVRGRQAPPDGAASPSRRDAADTWDLKVVTARLCGELTRAHAQWTCRDPVEPIDRGRLYFYTRIASPDGAEIEHHWYRGDELVQRVPLRVAASRGAGYRTFSQQTIREGSGPWRVELRSADAVLQEEHFVVR